MYMNKEQILGIVRHALTFVGGIIIMNGLPSDSTIQEIIGTIMTLIGGIWSVVNKQKVEQ